MKFISINTKLNIAVIGVSSIILIISSIILFWYAQQIKVDVYKSVQQDLIIQADDDIKSKMDIGITNAYSIANDERIKLAYKSNKREYAIDALKEISVKMRENTSFKNIKIHLHTKDNKSFLRNWDPSHYGDDLSYFRYDVVAVNKTKQPIVTFETGKAGLLLRAIIPISYNDHKHLGSLEFIQGLNSIAEDFDKKNIGFLLLMDEKIKENITRGKIKSSEDKIFGTYIISQKFINQDFLNDVKKIEIKRLLKEKYLVTSKYYYTYKEIKDFQNNILGIAILEKPLTEVERIIVNQKNLIYMALFGIFLMAVIISIIIILAIRKLVTKPLKAFENGLLDFFLFLQAKKDYVLNIDIDSNDEFGVMAESLRENIAVSARLHEEINDLNQNLENKIEQKTKKISVLLDNAGQGFLTFDKNFIIDEEYSKECIKLLGDKIGRKNIAELLFEDNLKREFFRSTLLEALNEPMAIKRNSYLSLLPQITILNKKALKLEYKILEDSYFMLILTNITSQRKLENKMKKEQETFKMIVSIVSESGVFFDLKKEYGNFINNYKKLIDIKLSPKHNIGEIYRAVHTFKGSFSQMYMQNIVGFLHDLETKISLMLKKEDVTNEELIHLLDQTNFKENLDESLKIIIEILGDDFLNAQNFLKINLSNILALQDKIANIVDKVESTSPECQDILCHVQNLSNYKLIDLLRPYNKLVQQLASKFGKEIYEFDIAGDTDITVSENIKPFIKSLIHIFRNSVDHGIESYEKREELQKDEIGTITCSIQTNNDNIHIIIEDDGSGIDIEKIKNKAVSFGIDTSKMNDEEIYNLIFEDGFSTKDRVDEISGRGVGMAVVKNELEKINGVIQIKSLADVGTTFEFIIPNKG
ncbi:hypothetical protein KKA17_05885 [bacterium]|nr:hypothetical protein [bacterium]MBU1884925.1 hypothetical protein [bacterium]